MTDEDKINYLSELLAKYQRGEHTPQEGKAIEKWLDKLGAHRVIKTTVNPPENLASTIYENILSQEFKKNTKTSLKKGRIIWATSIAASLLLAFIFWIQPSIHHEPEQAAEVPVNYHNGDVLPGKPYATLVYPQGHEVELTSPDLRSYAKNENQTLKINTPVASTYNVLLEDGTQVWLNAASTITYPEKFATNERRVILKGEAYFKVAHDKKRPFLIEANNATIEVLGTTFNVNAYQSTVLTTLVEGSVKIKSGEKNNIIKPGEQALCYDTQIQISPADEQKNLAWQRGEFYFDGNNITEICAQISRWYDVKFIGTEQLSSNSSFKGSIARDQNLSKILNILAIATDVNFEIKMGTVIAHADK
ncbi:FecR family protein [Sphingobacterium sp. JB170]|uniref:FecR family protein n=1 Tax=Sphingobacterium sp. JB170 TaxID=1434842 RepID=UPI00097F5B12|nr:FecR family protein [Sphingobacterium sp. JB170]SJN19686.1 putative anti-sigma factor [Sphingobacterium sp. JB170]